MIYKSINNINIKLWGLESKQQTGASTNKLLRQLCKISSCFKKICIPLQQLAGPLDQKPTISPAILELKDLHLEISVQMEQAASSSYSSSISLPFHFLPGPKVKDIKCQSFEKQNFSLVKDPNVTTTQHSIPGIWYL